MQNGVPGLQYRKVLNKEQELNGTTVEGRTTSFMYFSAVMHKESSMEYQ